jgi:tetratricopeptide (TPR) repeat protein
VDPAPAAPPPTQQNNPKSRPALALLAYCYYYVGNFDSAASMYETLARLYPEVESYKMYHAQSLFKASAYPDALRITKQIDAEVELGGHCSPRHRITLLATSQDYIQILKRGVRMRFDDMAPQYV